MSRIISQAYWLTATQVAWNPSRSSAAGVPTDVETKYWLNGGSVSIIDGTVSSSRYRMALDPAGTVGESSDICGKFKYLSGFQVLVCADLDKLAGKLLLEDLVLTVERPDGKVLYSTGVQAFGVIDDVAFYDGDDLGVRIDSTGLPSFKLWAPTARNVRLLIFERGGDRRPQRTVEMRRGAKGVWSYAGESAWLGKFYLYEVEVYVPSTGKVEKNVVTDPYSFSLSANSKKSQVVDLNEPKLKPKGWDKLIKRGPAHPVDQVIYELHVRDFSSADLTVASELRGKYRAFAEQNTLGTAHLRKLAQAGLTHVHLLPVFDFATVLDLEEERLEPEIPLGLPPDSMTPQSIMAKHKGKDAFNWGYDPLHYFTPEGSYSVNPDGPSRIREFREMVKGLHDVGLRVIMDVVFNHTFAGGQNEHSVFDKVVPDYYYRQNADGYVETSVCGGCPDTATEHAMMGKLMCDAIVHWARQYKIDGFRFDLMGHHTKDSILAVRKALDELTIERDGVDGKRLYLYGEGWKFGSLDAIMPDQACVQWNMFDTGIGTFNDRLRDKVRGGHFSHATRTEQGFATGLFTDDNGLQGIKPDDQKNRLLQFTDVIRVGMAGNIRAFRLKSWLGHDVYGDKVDAGDGTPAAYAARPEETVNYVSAHDNYELWDQIAAKAPFNKPGREPGTASAEDRARMQRLALGIVALSQGVPFFTAGSDFLRSKSGDGDSYDAGDWFNRIDWGMSHNNWGVGLPTEEKNGKEWDFWAPRLRDWKLQPSAEQMNVTAEQFQALLRIRSGSPLFRLRTLEQIQERVNFLGTELGMDQPPGLLAMLLVDDLAEKTALDPERKSVLAVWNASRQSIRFGHEKLKGRALVLHREWRAAFEPRLSEATFSQGDGVIVVPAQTLLVYEERR